MGLGFNVVKGSCTTALDPMSEREQRKIELGIVAEHGRRFHQGLSQPQYPVPTLFKLCGFRAARTSMGGGNATDDTLTLMRFHVLPDKGGSNLTTFIPRA